MASHFPIITSWTHSVSYLSGYRHFNNQCPLEFVAGFGLVANKAWYLEIFVPAEFTFAKIGWVNSNVTGGNIDAGLYDASGTRLRSTGSTAQGSGNTIQMVSVTELTISRGFYFLAFVHDDAANQRVFMFAHQGAGTGADESFTKVCRLYTQTSAFPLPATATMTPTGASAWNGPLVLLAPSTW